MTRDIQLDKELLEKIQKLKAGGPSGMCCDFCGASGDTFGLSTKTVIINGMEFAHYLCRRCGNSKFLLLEMIEKND